jgi:hypothetical protein
MERLYNYRNRSKFANFYNEYTEYMRDHKKRLRDNGYRNRKY